MTPLDASALTLLVDILDAGNLSQAARKLKMTRANVSYHLNQLERAVGMQLVRRTTRRVEPTEAGLRLLQHGRAIQGELTAAQEALASLGQGLHGRVRLGVPTGFGQVVLAPWLIDFKRRHPGIVLDVLFDNRVDDLLRDEVDLAVRVMSEPPPTLVAHTLGPVRHVACAAPHWIAANPMALEPEALSQAPVLTAGVSGRSLRLAAYRGSERREVALEPTLTSENFQFLHQAVDAGLGIELLPDYVVAADVAAGRLGLLLTDWRLSIFGTHMVVLHMPDRYQTRAIRTFLDELLALGRTRLAEAAQVGAPA
ncbi:LysR family transcriptional regulator [Sphaerotilus microaerophilus]|jgi:DNA-binding transcriptional LysR family regulator|uniref:LysR family transcriptional regulator n=1 Tax=Sphaerotilus microaerophilus TaxID=2914710 RepID=A0ABN6PN23_9BURK|nr:LysR family transcriptional regulator [Sphaerotilus sp. FB-5]